MKINTRNTLTNIKSNIENLEAGAYFIKIQLSDKVSMQKIILDIIQVKFR